MEPWIIFIIIAQFINAVVVLIDKYVVVSPRLPDPVVYAFYVAVLSSVAIFALPFGVAIPGLVVIAHALVSALCFIGAMLSLFLSFRKADASDVVPVIGAVAALSSFILSYFLIQSVLPPHFFLGFLLLVIGMFILSRFNFSLKTFGLLIISGSLFGASSVFIKLIFFETDFINGFFWSRMANVAVVPVLFLVPGTIKKIFFHGKSKKEIGHFGGLVALSKTLAGIAFLFTLGAIQLGDISLVNALAGLQFVFLLIFAILFSPYFPDYFNETRKKDKKILLNKILGVLIVVAGFMLLFL